MGWYQEAGAKEGGGDMIEPTGDVIKDFQKESRACHKRKERTLAGKALAVIEILTCNDELEGSSPEHQLLGKIYMFAHVAVGCCKNPHEDWVRELESTYLESGSE